MAGAGGGPPRLAPRGYEVVLYGLLIAAFLVVGYALISRVWPGSLAEDEIYARIGQPFGYWNAVGVTAAMALPAALWLAARRSGEVRLAPLAYPLVGLLVLALFLTASRGALAAALIGVALWFAFVPLRLRSLTVLAVGAIGAAPLIAWALSKDAFTKDLVDLQVRESVSTEFGIFLLLMTLVLLAAGLAVHYGAARYPPSDLIRRRAGTAAVAAACAIPIVLLGALAVSDRGIGGTLSDRVAELTSETSRTSGGPERLTTTSSSRGRYWRQAGEVFEDRPALGTGAGTFGVARLRYRNDQQVARHAHGYPAQTIADLGLLGLVASLLAAGAWLVAAARTTGMRPGQWRSGWGPERIGLVAAALAALIFGIQSTIDWTWFIPGPAVMALVAAGFVAGRGRPAGTGAEADEASGGALAAGDASDGRDLAPVAGGAPGPGETGSGEPPTPPGGGDPEASGAEPATTELPAQGPGLLARLRPASGATRLRLGFAAGVLLSALLTAWAVWQPQRSESKSDEAIRLADRDDLNGAFKAVKEARDINPLSPEPLFIEAGIEKAGGARQAALRTLQEAVADFPGEAQTWLRLANFQLNDLNQPREALKTLDGALYLDPRSSAVQAAFLTARSRAESPGSRRPPAR